MARISWLVVGVGLVTLGSGGCGGDDGGGGGGGGGGTPQKPKDVLDIVVDANRDGVVNATDPGDQQREEEWAADVGASFIANLDDDDLDGIRDAEDEIINGPQDQADLATFQVTAWPTVPELATGVILIDPESAENVRVFKKNPDGSMKLVMGSIGPCTSPNDCSYVSNHRLTPEETKNGTTFAIEGRRFKGQPLPSLLPEKKSVWTGMVELTYLVEAPNGGGRFPTEDNPDGFDKAKLRVAPWILFGSLDPHSWLSSSKQSTPFVEDNTLAAGAATGVSYEPYAASYNAELGWGDVWTEDFFQTGWTGFPGPNGTTQSMRIYNPRPWGRAPFNNPSLEQRLEYAPIRWLMGNKEKDRKPAVLGPDRGVAAFYDPEHEGAGHTQDSHGAHDLIPPHPSYPVGRIITSTKVYQETRDFYAAQDVQGPPMIIDTSWLAVEHVDEFFHWVPAKNALGWKLLVASPALMTTMLEKMKADGHGAAVIHAGKGGFFEMTVDQALANANLASWSQTADVKIQGHLDEIKAETGLTDADIIELPTWFENLGANELVAWNPGMVNMRMLGNVADVPKPFGPLIAGKDPFEEDFNARIGTPVNQLGTDGQGLKVFFTDGWYYHAALGEVHCGTNASAPAPGAQMAWWESGK